MNNAIPDGRTIIRAAHDRQNPYVMIRRAIFHGDLRVKNLFDKGLMAYLLSLPDNWKISVEHLAAENDCNKETISKSLNRLIDQGYIVRNKVAAERGRFGGYEYLVYEEPVNQASAANTPASSPTPNDASNQNPLDSGVSPYPVLPYTVAPDTVPPYTVKPSLLSNEYNNKNIYNPDEENSEGGERILNQDELLKLWQPPLEQVNINLKMGMHKPITQAVLDETLVGFNALYLGKTYNDSFKLVKLIARIASDQMDAKIKSGYAKRTGKKPNQSPTPIADRFNQHQGVSLTEDQQRQAQQRIQNSTADTPF